MSDLSEGLWDISFIFYTRLPRGESQLQDFPNCFVLLIIAADGVLCERLKDWRLA